MRTFVTALVILVNFILQSTWFSSIELFDIRPNTALIIIVSFAILRYDVEGAVIGFFAGLLQDIAFGKALGVFALIGMITGYVCGKPFKDFYRENFLLPLFLVIGATVFYEFSIYITHFLFRNRLDIFYYMRRIMLPSVCYNAFLTIPVYRFIYGVNTFMENKERPSRKLF